MGLRTVSAETVAPPLLHAAFGAAFADYLNGPFNLPLDQWPQLLGRQVVDLALSRVAMQDGQVLAFAYTAQRPAIGHWRLAAMGAVPQARGSGAAAALLDDFIARAGAAGMQGVELECFAQNERALRLYRGRGFEPLHELHGWRRPADAQLAPAEGGSATPVALQDAFAWLDALAQERADLPLQVTPPSLRALPVALQAWRLASAMLVFSAGPAGLTVHSLVDAQPAQRDAQALVAQLLARHPGQAVTVPQLQRPDLGGQALLRLGFERQPLHQLLLRRAL
jgi:ribosomal protein S18 acetylase RimI-like enzyme